MTGLKLIEKKKFGSITCDVYEKDDEYFVTREQIGKALGYKNPRKAISDIHNRHKERLDKFSVVRKLRTPSGQEKEIFLYSAKGIYEICRWSTQPKADAFYDFMYELLENIRTKKIKLSLEKQTPEWQQLRLTAKGMYEICRLIIVKFNAIIYKSDIVILSTLYLYIVGLYLTINPGGIQI